MKPVLPFILFLLITPCCFAQDYACFLPAQKQYFINSYGYLRGMRIDSVKTGGTTIFYPFQTPRGKYTPDHTKDDTLDANGGSWLGKQVTALADGTWLFDDIWNDTVVIKTQAHTGDSWVFLKDTSDVYYEANVTAEDTMTVMGVLDSVKKINITAYDSSGVASDSVNSFQIILSKAHGFAQVFDLYTFPYHYPHQPYQKGIDYYLDKTIPETYAYIVKYLVEPSIGYQTEIFKQVGIPSTSQEKLYDYSIGDVIEYNDSHVIPLYIVRLDTIKNKTVLPNGVEYNCSGWENNYQGLNSYMQPIFAHHITARQLFYDTATIIMTDTVLMPEEYMQPAVYYYQPNDTNYCINSALFYYESNYLWENISPWSFENGYSYDIYKEGLGFVLEDVLTGEGGDQSRGLNYWKLNGRECGNYMPDAVKNVQKQNTAVKLFPNPADNVLNILLQGTGTYTYPVSVSNVMGQVVYSGLLKQQENKIAVGRLPEGMYIVRIQEDNGNMTERKIMIVH